MCKSFVCPVVSKCKGPTDFQFTQIFIQAHANTFPSAGRSDPPASLRLIVHTDATRILQDSSSTLPLRKKSSQHIAAVSQDE